MHKLAKLDREHVWHPFTQMQDWAKEEPIVITEGKGATVKDAHGKSYIDANSSIWTNLHGHNHPTINRAIQSQLKKIAHSSALGYANEPASLLAEKLVKAVNPPHIRNSPEQPQLPKVFYSDDGSTAMEVAIKLAYEFTRRTGRSKKPRFLSLDGGYHGDTVGAVSVGHIDLFHKAYSGILFKADKVMTPYCYRCPYNRAKPERTDAREARKCNWECVGKVEQTFAKRAKTKTPISAMIVEPRMQGPAGMIAQPIGWLKRVAEIVRGHGALLISDEVMTGFGRTGPSGRTPGLFASHSEDVQPDLLAVAKGLTGGYLPMAATFTSQEIFDAFLGDYSEFKTFFHGHSFTGNQLGAAAGIASLDLLLDRKAIARRRDLAGTIRAEMSSLWKHPQVGDIRQTGLVASVELVRDWKTQEPFDLSDQAGIRVCRAMTELGVLAPPIGNVIVVMPPYCSTDVQVRKIIRSLSKAITSTFGKA